ncbi:hypothetical protein MANES_14G071201v8 [Manihot esculenta]|uniref:Uncharacterized protein n=1 Tax=Manihot esculenta TaxID=3983 RepID=A0ACB7GGJ3_MANES|nr:hypothetical protein MANES_14G071201v8 [Manihot esculenta]
MNQKHPLCQVIKGERNGRRKESTICLGFALKPRSKKGSIRLVVGIQMESDGKSSIDFLSLRPFISASESGTGRSQGFRLSKNKT